MSQFDPSAPNSGYQCVHLLVTDGEKRYGAQTGNTTASAVAALNTGISVSTAYNIVNQNCKGAIFYWNLQTIAAGSQTAKLKIRMAQDPIMGGGTQPVIAASAQLSASAQTVMVVYPTVISAGLSANSFVSPLPRNYQAVISVSNAAATNIVFSLSVMHLL